MSSVETLGGWLVKDVPHPLLWKVSYEAEEPFSRATETAQDPKLAIWVKLEVLCVQWR